MSLSCVMVTKIAQYEGYTPTQDVSNVGLPHQGLVYRYLLLYKGTRVSE